jgi:hypothetical protein
MDDEEAGTAAEKVTPDRTNPNSVAGTASITTQEVGVRLETCLIINFFLRRTTSEWGAPSALAGTLLKNYNSTAPEGTQRLVLEGYPRFFDAWLISQRSILER